MFGYSLNYLIDLKSAVIVDVEATPTRISKEVAAAETMVERTEQRLELKPDRLAGDVACGTGGLLAKLVKSGIDPHVPMWDRPKRQDDTVSRDDFTFDNERDVYLCPGGKMLKTTGRVRYDKTRRYRASKFDCEGCPLKPKCCRNTPARTIPRDVNEAARDHARSLRSTPRPIDNPPARARRSKGRSRKPNASLPGLGSGFAV